MKNGKWKIKYFVPLLFFGSSVASHPVTSSLTMDGGSVDHPGGTPAHELVERRDTDHYLMPPARRGQFIRPPDKSKTIRVRVQEIDPLNRERKMGTRKRGECCRPGPSLPPFRRCWIPMMSWSQINADVVGSDGTPPFAVPTCPHKGPSSIIMDSLIVDIHDPSVAGIRSVISSRTRHLYIGTSLFSNYLLFILILLSIDSTDNCILPYYQFPRTFLLVWTY